MKYVMLILVIFFAGCDTIQYAGVASYKITPAMLDNKLVCCAVDIKNGKEIGAVIVHVEKHGNDYTVDLQETNILAFKGQEISANFASQAVVDTAKAATMVLIAPIGIPAVAGAAGAIIKGITK